MLAVVALVALRLGIGWQFFKEGTAKIHDDGFSSAGFLGAAKGPLAGAFKSMSADPDGLHRLKKQETADAWKAYHAQAARHFGFGNDDQMMATRKKLEEKRKAAKKDEEKQKFKTEIDQLNRRIEKVRNQPKLAEALLKQQLAMLDEFFAGYQGDIEQYQNRLERRRKIQDEPEMSGVSTLRAQAAEIEGDLVKERRALTSKIDAMWDVVEQSIWNLAVTEQQQEVGPLRLARPGEYLTGVGWVDAAVPYSPVQVVDRVLPYFDLIVGALLILGLFTRTTSIVGATFLASVVATQWPTAIGAAPTFYQFNLMLALLVLAATGAGRFGGLDFFVSFAIQKIRSRCCPPRQSTTSETNDESNA